jgi:hypothetical protein
VRTISSFVEQIQCFSDMEVVRVLAGSQSKAVFHVAVCSAKDLSSLLEKEAYTIHALENDGQTVAKALLFIDPLWMDRYKKIGADYNNLNGLYHEFLHLLWVGHPDYVSVQEQLRCRSVVEDTARPHRFFVDVPKRPMGRVIRS